MSVAMVLYIAKSGNVTAAAVRDNDVQLTLVTDATMGGSSLTEGQVHHTCCGKNRDRDDIHFHSAD
jgi:hypothetical protein